MHISARMESDLVTTYCLNAVIQNICPVFQNSRYLSDPDPKIAHHSPSLQGKYFLSCDRKQSHGFCLIRPWLFSYSCIFFQFLLESVFKLQLLRPQINSFLICSLCFSWQHYMVSDKWDTEWPTSSSSTVANLSNVSTKIHCALVSWVAPGQGVFSPAALKICLSRGYSSFECPLLEYSILRTSFPISFLMRISLETSKRCTFSRISWQSSLLELAFMYKNYRPALL